MAACSDPIADSVRQLLQQLRHLDRDQCRLLALVAVAAAGALERVLVGFDREHAVADRQAVVERDPHQSLGTAIGDLLVMAGVTADHATERDDRDMRARRGDARGRDRDFPRAGHPDHVDHVFDDAIVDERLARAGDQRIGDARIPAAGEDRETGAVSGAQVAFEVGHVQGNPEGGPV